MQRGERDDRQEGDYDSRWLQLLLDVALIANRAESVESALHSAMDRVCQHNGWHAAFSQIAGRSGETWYLLPDEISEQGVDAEARRLARQWALQVMETGRIQFVDNFTIDLEIDFELPGKAPESGGAIAAPLLVGGRSVGAMVFYSRHPLTEDLDADQFASLLRVIESIGTQMGRVAERWHLLRCIAEEAEKERETLGREIHDSLAQQIVGVKLLAQSLRSNMGETASSFSEQWNLLIENLSRAQAQARALARGLSAGTILSNSESLIDQLEEFADVIGTGHEVQCSVEVDGAFSLDDDLTRTQLFRIAREAVFNALRHADATHIVIAFRTDVHRLILEVRDDGSGMPAVVRSREGMGISGMRYRAGIIGGRLELESEPGKGTVVRCVL
jgi:signal transduction histidine kinase